MDIIHLLPDSVANQIAAGEVIQRPASCLKELVENSLDAGAQHIRIIVVDAGRTLLQVIDDGCGMSPMDARMAFERHATSKIRETKDLFALHTMGFRGEALASICAVAHVEVMTRTKDSEIGTLIEIAGSEVVRQEPCQCPVGTNFKVKDLFYNVPVRRKFLKTDATELRNIWQEFYHIALVYPQVQFTVVNQDEVVLELPKQTYKQRIEAIFGKSAAKPYSSQLIDVHVETEMVTISGFVGKPETAARTAHQYFFVNGRYMRHPYFHKAVMTAYFRMLPGELVPAYFLYFTIHPQQIDVNIHPTKTEIKFQDEQYIFQILVAAIREALGKFNITPSLDFNRDNEVEIPTLKDRSDEVLQTPHITVDPNYNPFKNASVPRGWQTLYQPLQDESRKTAALEVESVEEAKLFDTPPQDLPYYSYADTYILLPSSRGLLFINQHRAHFHVLYHRLMEQMQAGKGLKQQVLFPESWNISYEEQQYLQAIEEDLAFVGFTLEPIGRLTYTITSVPAMYGERSALPVLKDILDEVKLAGTSVREQWQKRISMTLAADMAIPYGKHLAEKECRKLIEDLFTLEQYKMAPDGKTIMFLMQDEEIKKHF